MYKLNWTREQKTVQTCPSIVIPTTAVVEPVTPPVFVDVPVGIHGGNGKLGLNYVYPDAPWCWNIYLHLPQKWPSFCR